MSEPRPPEEGAGELLTRLPTYELAEHIAAEAERLAGCAVGLYVVDVSGRTIRRVAGAQSLPEELEIPMAIGPELPQSLADELQRRLTGRGRGLCVFPLWLRHRAIAVLLSEGPPDTPLTDLAREAAAAIELADGYGDTFEGPRRRADMSAASELQENLLPPRIAGVPGAEIAGSVLPAYEVGGDWFDIAVTADGAYLAIADAVGKGPKAAALSALSVGAQRAVRRRGGSLEEAARAIHEVIAELDEEAAFLTAVLAEWRSESHELSWILCGHPAPLRVRRDGRVEELAGPGHVPLGLLDDTEELERGCATIRPGEAFVLYSDGVTERRDHSGEPIGLEGLVDVLAGMPVESAASVVSAIQDRVFSACADPLRDDATLIVLAPTGPAHEEPPTPGD